MVWFLYPFPAPDTYCTQEESAWRKIKENKNLMTLLPSPSPLYCQCVLLFLQTHQADITAGFERPRKYRMWQKCGSWQPTGTGCSFRLRPTKWNVTDCWNTENIRIPHNHRTEPGDIVCDYNHERYTATQKFWTPGYLLQYLKVYYSWVNAID